MDYQTARKFIEDTKQYGSILGLDSIRRLMHELLDVQETLHIIHVAGTNGKGSTCAMLASILQEAGYCVGRYSSPAVFDYREIYQIDGQPIEKEDFAEYASQVKAACQRLVELGHPHPTVFEVETAIAFLYFAQKACQLVILETGMGGETDATNLISAPVCSVLTSISMDHMGFLGDTLAQIAKVKAGIIKAGRPVVALQQNPQAMQVIEKRAKQLGCRLRLADPQALTEVFYTAENLRAVYEPVGELCTPLTGAHQVLNMILAVETVRELCACGYPVSKKAILSGLQKVSWRGRFETLTAKPRIIIDGAHNEDAARKLQLTIENCFTNTPITYIIGVLADKEHEKMLRCLLPYARKVYTVTPQNPRALDGEVLCREAQKYHSDVTSEKSVADAVNAAVAGAGEGEVILAFGSLSYLAEVSEAAAQLPSQCGNEEHNDR